MELAGLDDSTATTEDVAVDPKKTVGAIKRELAALHRRLVIEEDEQELIELFRETKRLKKRLSELAPVPVPRPRPSSIAVNTSWVVDPAAAAAAAAPKPSSSVSRASSATARSAPSPPPAHRKPTLSSPTKPLASKMGSSRRKRFSAVGMINRPMYVPADVPGAAPPSSGEGYDVVEDKEGAEGPGGTGDGDDGGDGDDEFFVCAECGKEDYGQTDERDGNFYCNACWETYTNVGAPLPDSPGRLSNISVEDPTHPDYWDNQKKLLNAMEAPLSPTLEESAGIPASPSQAASTGKFTSGRSKRYWKAPQGVRLPSKQDLFAHFGIDDVPVADDNESYVDHEGKERFDSKATGAGQMDAVVDAMLMRIQDKRKSMRFIKNPTPARSVSDLTDPGKPSGKKFATGKNKGSKAKIAKKNKKKKADPKALAEASKVPIELGPRGLLVDDPSNPIPVPKPEIKRPAILKKPMRPQELFPLAENGTIVRSLYAWEREAVVEHCFLENPGPAVQDWAAKNHPVRAPIAAFILTEFGKVVDTNLLDNPVTEEQEPDDAKGGWQPVNDPYGGSKSATVAAPAVAPADYPASATAYNQSI